MLSPSSPSSQLCPHCLERGVERTLRFVPHGVLTFLMCDHPMCSYNLEGHHIVKQAPSEDAPILRSHVMRLNAPLTLLRDPKVKRKHLQKLFWVKKMKTNIHEWMVTEVHRMNNYSISPIESSSQEGGSKYEISEDVKRLLEFNSEDIEVCMHLVPDLKRIFSVIKSAYDLATQSNSSAS